MSQAWSPTERFSGRPPQGFHESGIDVKSEPGGLWHRDLAPGTPHASDHGVKAVDDERVEIGVHDVSSGSDKKGRGVPGHVLDLYSMGSRLEILRFIGKPGRDGKDRPSRTSAEAFQKIFSGEAYRHHPCRVRPKMDECAATERARSTRLFLFAS